MANILVVSGPQAVGKMTVAEEIKKRINYSLMVNHDSIEVSDKIFGRDTLAQKELNKLIRKDVFNTAIKYNIDIIFTYLVAYDTEHDIDYINYLIDLFESSGGTFYFVELKADLETRLERNVTPHRLESKFSKNDIERSRNDLLKTMDEHRLNSLDDEFLCKNHYKIDNTNLSPEEVAEMVINRFNLANKE